MTVKIVKANDQAEDTLTTFSAETITVGHDEDGAPRTANIVATRAVAEVPKDKPLPFKHVRALDGLMLVLGAHGRDVEAAAGVVRAVALEQWRDELVERGVIAQDAVNKRDAFARIKNAMLKEKLIDERAGFVWPVQAGGMFSNIPSPPIQPLSGPPLPPLPPPPPLPPSHVSPL